MKPLALCLLAAATGCTKTDSSDVLTSGIYAGITAQSAGDGVTYVSATLYLGNPLNLNFVDLTGDDQLFATHNSERKEMVESTILNLVQHNASFSTDADGEQFHVAFERTVDGGAPDSIATLPAKFALAASPGTASRAQALTMTWGPTSTDAMSWQVRGDCIEDEAQTLTGDTGTLTIEANRIVKRMGTNIADSCQVTLTVTRTKMGTLDPGYGKGGLVQGQQVRTVTFTSTP